MLKKFDPTTHLSRRQQAKSSAHREIRTKLQELYPRLGPFLDEILPKKQPLIIAKWDFNQLLIVGNTPVFFSIDEGPWLPTLRLLHQYPFMMPHVQVDRGAIKFVLSAANIMCPGLTSKGGNCDVDLPANVPVAVMAENKVHALAIGILKLSTSEIRRVNKGIGIETIHHLGDPLWRTTEVQ
ncbi:hypothetical protein HMI54_007585 [Coelomomyces lativittatus]|nr:hypothetical protein HMI56_003036 [Coelomomyces lativittatus]KAJ1502685.1 hypothetical protein HMI55_002785 [Coelomomyces lativittatus]KAJ1503952.1 hypothetical protein HMI54_007585 [Coelomomyces lativittatus]